MQRIIYIFSVCLLLIACSTLSEEQFLNSPFHVPPVGSRVQLHQRLNVEPGYSRAFIQGGESRMPDELKIRDPYCQFYRFEPPEALQTRRYIEMDEFLIIRAYQSEDIAVLKPQRLARLSTAAMFIMDDDSPSSMTLSTVMKLKSGNQPEIIELKCAIFTDPFVENFLSIKEIQTTLGKVATLHIQL